MSDEKYIATEEEFDTPFSGQPSPMIILKNHIYFYANIDEVIAKTLISALHEVAMEIINVSFDHNVPIVPIELHINSCGGEVSSAIGIVKTIEDIQNGTIHKIGDIPIKVPVNTHIEGECDSAASLIACVGNHRTISKHSLSLIHDVRIIGGISGINKSEDIATQAVNIEMFKQIFYDIYLKHSKLTYKKLEEISGNERYSTPEELLKYGLVDEIV